MDRVPGFEATALHLGTDLFLCGGTRRVRVLTAPWSCDRRNLRYSWDDCFGTGDDDLVQWPSDWLRLTSAHLN